MNEQQLPPHNAAAERAVLGSYIIDPEAIIWGQHEGLEPAHFYNQQLGAICQAVYDLHSAGRDVDYLTIGAQMVKNGAQDTPENLAILPMQLVSETPTSTHARSYAVEVRDAATRRQIIQQAGETAALAYDETQTVTDILRQHAAGAAQFAHAVSTDFKPSSALAVANAFVDQLDNLIKNGNPAAFSLPTGLRDLDSIVGGGLKRKEVCLIAARPGMGKSVVAQNIALHMAAQGFKGFYWSGEMGGAQVMARACATLLYQPAVSAPGYGPTYQHILDGGYMIGTQTSQNPAEAGLINQIYGALYTLGQLPITYDFQPGITSAELEAKVLVNSTLGLDWIVVDHIHLMNPDKITGHVPTDIGSISKGLKRLAMLCDVPVIACVQLSRGSEHTSDHIPGLADLRGSGSLEEDAATVLFPFWEDYYDKFADRTLVSHMDLITGKNRYGPTNNVRVRCDLARNKVRNV